MSNLLSSLMVASSSGSHCRYTTIYYTPKVWGGGKKGRGGGGKGGLMPVKSVHPKSVKSDQTVVWSNVVSVNVTVKPHRHQFHLCLHGISPRKERGGEEGGGEGGGSAAPKVKLPVSQRCPCCPLFSCLRSADAVSVMQGVPLYSCSSF